MLLGYNTNGFAHHTPEQAMRVLAEIGYRAVALTIDHTTLDPRDVHAPEQLGRLRRAATRYGLELVIETGARYLLDPWVKHEPTLVTADDERRGVRIAFYRYAIEAAAALEARCVSLWSGVDHGGAKRNDAMERLAGALTAVLDHAATSGVTVAFEPEPGMVVATLADYAELKERLGPAGAALRLTIDVGHLHCQGETPIADRLAAFADDLVNVHVEDMRAGEHEHLMFGEGEIAFPPVLAKLAEIGFDGPVCVELSRHSHEAPSAARRAYDFLAPMVGD